LFPRLSLDESLDRVLGSEQSVQKLSLFAKVLAIISSGLIGFAVIVLGAFVVVIFRGHGIWLIGLIALLGLTTMVFNVTSLFLERGKPNDDV
jgi:hypothetical protein